MIPLLWLDAPASILAEGVDGNGEWIFGTRERGIEDCTFPAFLASAMPSENSACKNRLAVQELTCGWPSGAERPYVKIFGKGNVLPPAAGEVERPGTEFKEKRIISGDSPMPEVGSSGLSNGSGEAFFYDKAGSAAMVQVIPQEGELVRRGLSYLGWHAAEFEGEVALIDRPVAMSRSDSCAGVVLPQGSEETDKGGFERFVPPSDPFEDTCQEGDEDLKNVFHPSEEEQAASDGGGAVLGIGKESSSEKVGVSAVDRIVPAATRPLVDTGKRKPDDGTENARGYTPAQSGFSEMPGVWRDSRLPGAAAIQGVSTRLDASVFHTGVADRADGLLTFFGSNHKGFQELSERKSVPNIPRSYLSSRDVAKEKRLFVTAGGLPKPGVIRWFDSGAAEYECEEKTVHGFIRREEMSGSILSSEQADSLEGALKKTERSMQCMAGRDGASTVLPAARVWRGNEVSGREQAGGSFRRMDVSIQSVMMSEKMDESESVDDPMRLHRVSRIVVETSPGKDICGNTSVNAEESMSEGHSDPLKGFERYAGDQAQSGAEHRSPRPVNRPLLSLSDEQGRDLSELERSGEISKGSGTGKEVPDIGRMDGPAFTSREFAIRRGVVQGDLSLKVSRSGDKTLVSSDWDEGAEYPLDRGVSSNVVVRGVEEEPFAADLNQRVASPGEGRPDFGASSPGRRGGAVIREEAQLLNAGWGSAGGEASTVRNRSCPEIPSAPDPETKSLVHSVKIAEVGRFLLNSVFSSAKGGGEILLQLSPDHLGRLRIRIATEGRKVSVRMAAENATAKDLLESQIGHLRVELQGRGLEMARFEVVVEHVSDRPEGGWPEDGFTRGREEQRRQKEKKILDPPRRASSLAPVSPAVDGDVNFYA